jgi:hypothetical protein
LEIISSDKGHFRTFTTQKTISRDTNILRGDASPLSILKEKHLPSLNLLYRLHDIWGIDVVRLKRADDLYRALTGAQSITATSLVDLYGAKYIISVTPIEKDPRFELIYSRIEGLQGRKEDLLKENTIKLYRNHNALPRAWLVKDFKVMDSKTILSTITKKHFHPEREVFLEEEPVFPVQKTSQFFSKSTQQNSLPDKMSLPLQNKVELIHESNNRLKFLVEAGDNVILVLNDTFSPDWKVFIDGKEGKIYCADYNFRAVPLNAGTQKVEFVYNPLSFKLGAVTTFLGIIGCILIGLIAKRRRVAGMTNKNNADIIQKFI